MALCSNSTTGTTASLLSLPLELVEEILCRLPVKILLQLRCICKSWKSLISDDPKFAKKHLHMSKILKHQHLIVNVLRDQILWDSPPSDVFSNLSNHTVKQTKLHIPNSISRFFNDISEICSCDGILCFTLRGEGGRRSAVLCNPSLRKYSTLPPLKYHRKREDNRPSLHSFGYDHFNDVYKVIALSCFKDKHYEVDVYTLGTDYWRSIQDFPYSSCSILHPGVFVGGTVNWLAYENVSNSSFCCVIVSLDLKTESFQKFSLPGLKKDDLALGMFRDCLCLFVSSNMHMDVWIMKEYGIKESWAKLYIIPYVGKSHPNIVYIADDDQVLFCFPDLKYFKLVVCNTKNSDMKVERINGWVDPNIYVESLISLPCSY